jgi:hypothetical protein
MGELAAVLACTAALTTVVLLTLRLNRARVELRSLAGVVGTIALAIPEGGVGKVAHGARGRRSTLPARCADGGAIAKGARVVIVEASSRLAIVQRLPADIEEVFR